MAQNLARLNSAQRYSDNGEAAFELIPESGPRGYSKPRFRVGDLIEHRYRVFGNAATGGMGIVYVCEDTLLGRPVALKLMRSDSSPEQRFAERFFAEARITARVQ